MARAHDAVPERGRRAAWAVLLVAVFTLILGMMVGLLSGTYSTVFIAGTSTTPPMLTPQLQTNTPTRAAGDP